MSKKNKFETNAIHIGNEPDISTGSISPPIHLTSTYVQEGIGKNKGLQDNFIRSIYEDYQGNIWVGLNEGISKIKLNVNTDFYKKFRN